MIKITWSQEIILILAQITLTEFSSHQMFWVFSQFRPKDFFFFFFKETARKNNHHHLSRPCVMDYPITGTVWVEAVSRGPETDYLIWGGWVPPAGGYFYSNPCR